MNKQSVVAYLVQFLGKRSRTTKNEASLEAFQCWNLNFEGPSYVYLAPAPSLPQKQKHSTLRAHRGTPVVQFSFLRRQIRSIVGCDIFTFAPLRNLLHSVASCKGIPTSAPQTSAPPEAIASDGSRCRSIPSSTSRRSRRVFFRRPKSERGGGMRRIRRMKTVQAFVLKGIPSYSQEYSKN